MKHIESDYFFNFQAYNNDTNDDTKKSYMYDDLINADFTLPEGYILCIDYPIYKISNFRLDECKNGNDLLNQIIDAYLYVYNNKKDTSEEFNISKLIIKQIVISKLTNSVKLAAYIDD